MSNPFYGKRAKRFVRFMLIFCAVAAGWCLALAIFGESWFQLFLAALNGFWVWFWNKETKEQYGEINERS